MMEEVWERFLFMHLFLKIKIEFYLIFEIISSRPPPTKKRVKMKVEKKKEKENVDDLVCFVFMAYQPL